MNYFELLTIKRKIETEIKCTICCFNIYPSSISKATTMQNILKNIVLKCSNNTCNQTFNTKNVSNKKEHEQVSKERKSKYITH